MRSAFIFAAPFVAAAFAQESSSSSVDAHPQTTFLTQTNSLGVVTGQPTPDLSVATLPAGVTAQPVVATIPAGLPEGEHTITLNETGGLTAFVASVGSSTTVVINGGVVIPSVTTGATAGVQETTVTNSAAMSSMTGGAMNSGAMSSGASESGAASSGSMESGSSESGAASPTSSDAAASSASGSAKPSSSGNAAAGVQIASAGLLGLGAFIAALL